MKLQNHYPGRPWLIRPFVFLGAVTGMTLSATAVIGQAQPGLSQPIVQIIDPATVSPLIGAAPWDANGPAVTRRVVTHMNQGAVYLDMAYNTYKKGIRLAVPYAYKTDEFCFVPGGQLRMQDERTAYEPSHDSVMWRPSGGVTRSVEFLEDTVTICAMSPARLDANSHRIPPQDVGKWSGDPAAKPYPHWFPMTTGPVITAMDQSASAGVVEHEVLSKRKDGSAKVSVVYTTFQPGAYLAAGSAGEQICWVESGTLHLSTNSGTMTAGAHTFIYRPEGAKIDRIQANTPAAMTCFSGPAAF